MTMTNAVIDISHYQNVGSFDAVRNDGIIAVINKATQGASYVDPTYARHRAGAKAAGLLIGSYHFGAVGDGIAQADHFLSVVKPKEELLVLDFERQKNGQMMSLQDAEHFVHHVYSETGKYPGLYGGYSIKKALMDSGITTPSDTELSKCWLWIAQWSKAPLLPKGWGNWTLWQYTDGAAGPLPHEVASIGRCDRDQFNGSEHELRAFWARQLA